jgi:UDP-N-acetyl-D-galactosamine dehydrogenase
MITKLNLSAPDYFTDFEKIKIAVIGLGYVGLPLSSAFAKKYSVFGYDINETRIRQLLAGIDHTLEVDSNELSHIINDKSTSKGLYCTNQLSDIQSCNVFIITVPTPIDKYNRPNLTPLFKASETVGKVLKEGDTVIYESTVYPGVTEDECVPVLEKISGLKYNVDFFVGYSPERINPGDKEHTVTKILKVTSGSTAIAADFIDKLYGSIVSAGTFKAKSIRVAEAAKVIENSQRDINIAFVNELSKIFNRMDLNINDVLEAAGTKWNFLKFKPGLVGGHCIGVDPYYLAQKAQELGYHPEIILAGRRLNDGMGEYVANEVVKLMIKKDIAVKNSNILVLGITFKENCPDIRNTKVVDILNTLKSFHSNVTIFDPWVNAEEVKSEYGWNCVDKIDNVKDLDAIVLAVAHNNFKELKLKKYCKENHVIYDVKGILPNGESDGHL